MNNFIAYFYSDKVSIWQNISSLIQNAFVLYITDENPVPEVKNKLVINEDNQQIEVLNSSEFYLREQVVRAKPVIKAIEEKIKLIENPEIFIFIEMSWAVRTPSGDIYLRELHEAFQNFLLQNPTISIYCLYNESILLDEQLMLALNAHPYIYTLARNIENPYYLPPNIIKKNLIKPRFNYWLSQINPDRKQPNTLLNEEQLDEKKTYPLEKSFSTQIAQTEEGRWKIRCFGELKIRRENGETIEWNTKAGSTRKLKTIFAFLLIRGEKGASNEELADLLWPDAETTEQALNRLYHAIRYLRLILEGESQSKTKSSFIVHQGSNYFLRLPYDSWIDLPMFQELCFKGNQHLKEGNFEQVKICYESAERLYSGDLFSDIPQKYIDNNENDWLWSKRFWYREMYHKLLYSLANINRQLGDLSLSIKYCDKALAEDPNLEAAHREKLFALAESQRFDALHRQYRIYCESLKKFNLGQPSEDMRKLYLNLSRKN